MEKYSKQNHNRAYQIWLPLLLSLFSVMGMLIGYNLQKTPSVVAFETDDKDHNLQLAPTYGMGRVEEVLRYVDNQYVDDVDREKLTEKVIDDLLDELDPHSNYINADELGSVNENLEGSFVGIGIEFDILEDSIFVITAISDGPSDKNGIMAGDRIVEIEDSIVAGIGITTAGVTKRLKGGKGSKVRLGVKRRRQAELLHFEIERDEIPLKSIDAVFMLDKKTGYIKINRFSGTTYDEFLAGLDELMDQNMEDLVIDLRQNPGGYLTEATRILNQLIQKRNEMLVYTEGKHSTRRSYETKGIVKYKIDDIAILVDEGSASASEIMAGAIQDTDRGLIVGRRSFGKGLVQEQYDLSDGAALRLTVARYYTKSGRLIQKSYTDEKAYHSDREDRFSSGELKSRDSIHIIDTTKYFTDNGRIVYGGGGIIPDVFIPIDPILENKSYISSATYVPEFVYSYLDSQRGNILEMKEDKFISDFKIIDAQYEAFKDYVMKKDSSISESELDLAEREIKTRIKARVARNVFGQRAYFRVLMQSDEVINKTNKILDNSEEYLKKK